MLLIKGPNVMKGYYKMPEQTAKVMRGEWYVTGDMGMLDADGFIHITGRLSRFSKIGGEMVPHIHIEELLQRMLSDDDEELVVAVTAVPDERKGERLIVFHLPTDKTPEAIIKVLSSAGLPNLWIPSTDSLFEVEQIPVLGTGKLDLQAVREMALERVAGGSAANR
jgi:acyl-[acyl-carrier-protein]-phospholipid O-acyltransferase/long-chain-fatty-acid--[acyl-carrier-protein] ligase